MSDRPTEGRVTDAELSQLINDWTMPKDGLYSPNKRTALSALLELQRLRNDNVVRIHGIAPADVGRGIGSDGSLPSAGISPEPGAHPSCEYEHDADNPSLFLTGCGHEFYLDSGMELYDFCPHCGGSVEVCSPPTKTEQPGSSVGIGMDKSC